MIYLLRLVVCFLLGVAAQRIGTQLYVIVRRQAWSQKQPERRRERSARGPVMDSIDKRVQALAPQVWRQRRMADGPLTSSRSGWRQVV